MTIKLTRLNEDFHFQAENERGHQIEIDSRKEFGGSDLATSPMELLLMALAGCSAIDIVSILKKQKQQIDFFQTEVDGTRVKVGDATPFKNIALTIHLQGKIEPNKALKAAQLSFEKYCSVAKTVEPTATIAYKVILNNIAL
ncbi:OsmC family protein [Flavobacterium sp. SUN052]|uniref:OsmC family protein n=1 Tax=Flavobacterium sp. SUN052 TaxID=3002441 RepID=UPI00237E2711|nr:OsmC family protein [Flavobacterium sp. SUN052]MEC4004569.1 OsmC family protein [Flavobacterium sp. SUN052]